MRCDAACTAPLHPICSPALGWAHTPTAFLGRAPAPPPPPRPAPAAPPLPYRTAQVLLTVPALRDLMLMLLLVFVVFSLFAVSFFGDLADPVSIALDAANASVDAVDLGTGLDKSFFNDGFHSFTNAFLSLFSLWSTDNYPRVCCPPPPRPHPGCSRQTHPHPYPLPAPTPTLNSSQVIAPTLRALEMNSAGGVLAIFFFLAFILGSVFMITSVLVAVVFETCKPRYAVSTGCTALPQPCPRPASQQAS